VKNVEVYSQGGRVGNLFNFTENGFGNEELKKNLFQTSFADSF